jgi:N-acetylmuramoyl-L-alanine amidase
MREIKNIVLHCTATPQTTTVKQIQNFWKNELKWKMPGYHYIITPQGDLVQLASLEDVCNGVKNHNQFSVHVSYIGGVDEKNRAYDNRTNQQKRVMIDTCTALIQMYKKASILGHRDFPYVLKECPSFDVKEWCKCVGLSPDSNGNYNL